MFSKKAHHHQVLADNYKSVVNVKLLEALVEKVRNDPRVPNAESTANKLSKLIKEQKYDVEHNMASGRVTLTLNEIWQRKSAELYEELLMMDADTIYVDSMLDLNVRFSITHGYARVPVMLYCRVPEEVVALLKAIGNIRTVTNYSEDTVVSCSVG